MKTLYRTIITILCINIFFLCITNIISPVKTVAQTEIIHAVNFEDKKGVVIESDSPKTVLTQPIKSSCIDINTATADQLIKIKGIGNVLAERIIVYRLENGPFVTVQQILAVKGVGKAKLVAISASICPLINKKSN